MATNTQGGTTVTWAPTPSNLPSQQHNHLLHHASASATHSDPIKMNHAKIGGDIKTGTEIDRIMAKIEQARLSIAHVCVKIKTMNTPHIIDIVILLHRTNAHSTYLYRLFCFCVHLTWVSGSDFGGHNIAFVFLSFIYHDMVSMNNYPQMRVSNFCFHKISYSKRVYFFTFFSVFFFFKLFYFHILPNLSFTSIWVQKIALNRWASF